MRNQSALNIKRNSLGLDEQSTKGLTNVESFEGPYGQNKDHDSNFIQGGYNFAIDEGNDSDDNDNDLIESQPKNSSKNNSLNGIRLD